MEPFKRRACPSAGEDPAVLFPELLHFCSRAQTLIAELLLLSDHIPSQFLDPQFAPVLFDLRYLDSPGDFESRIAGNAELEALEDQLNESCSSYMQRFFVLVNGVIIYHIELVKYLNDLQEGLYLHSTLDGVLENKSGCQLLIESIALFGCLLLLMEHKMGGFLREKLLIAHLRYDRCFNFPKLERICLLCRVHLPPTSTSFHVVSSPSSLDILSIQRPEDLFARLPFPKFVLHAVICCVRSDDIYNNICFYPDPQHRTIALSLQGGYLFVLLFYAPEFLHNGLVMREIVDRFFKDNWVIPIFLHYSVDLFVSWDAYKEAKASLISFFSPTFIHDCSILHYTKVKQLLSELDSHLLSGSLSKDHVLDSSLPLLSLIRNCNTTLRWILLHRMSLDKKARDIVASVGLVHHVDENSLLQLLLKTAQLEFEVKKLYHELLETRDTMWHEKKSCVSECMTDLSQNHFGTWALSCKFKNKTLKDWFGNLSLEVSTLNYSSTGSSGRAIYRVMSALKDIEQLQQIEGNAQINHGLSKVQKNLRDMIKILNLDNETMVALLVITNAVYAWGYIARFDKILKANIKDDPSILLILHALFLKFYSLLKGPLLRIEQLESPDLPYISDYYSSIFTAKIFGILEIIPSMLLDMTFNETDLQVQQPFQLLNRIDRESVENFMELDQQLHLARQATKVSDIAEGIAIMSRNFDVLINLNLGDWLKENIRKELSRRLEGRLRPFSFSSHGGCCDLEEILSSLSTYMRSQLQKMEFFQDILHIHGSSIWEKALTAVLDHCALEEKAELRRYMRKSATSVLQVNDLSKSQNFLGYLLCQLMSLTDPSRSMFIEPMIGWFDAEGNELLGLHSFNLLKSCIGHVGLASLDSLLATLMKENLELTWQRLNVMPDATWSEVHKLDELLGPHLSIPLLCWSSYQQMFNMSLEPLVEHFATVGQLQLLRCLVSFKLMSAFKGVQVNHPTVELFHHALDEQQEFCGFLSPLQIVYITKDPPILLGRLASILSVSQLSRYVLDVRLGTLASRLKKSTLDFFPVILGLGTFLKQFHPFHMMQYIQYMVQHIRTVEATFGVVHERQKGSFDHTSEVSKAVFWITSFCKYMNISKDLSESCIPSSVVAILQS